MPDFVLSIRRFFAIGALAVALFCCSAPAGAQGIGFEGGATIDPNQFFVGTHFETGELMPHLRFRPGVDGSFGGSSDTSLATINIEFTYEIPLHSGWVLYQGGGPAIVLVRQSLGGTQHDTSVHAGSFYTFGFANESGFFTEFKYGGGWHPQLKFGAGYVIRMK